MDVMDDIPVFLAVIGKNARFQPPVKGGIIERARESNMDGCGLSFAVPENNHAGFRGRTNMPPINKPAFSEKNVTKNIKI